MGASKNSASASFIQFHLHTSGCLLNAYLPALSAHNNKTVQLIFQNNRQTRELLSTACSVHDEEQRTENRTLGNTKEEEVHEEDRLLPCLTWKERDDRYDLNR